MVTGFLQEKKGNYYAVLKYKDDTDKWKYKWISTGLKVEGNRRKAQDMLKKYIKEFNPLDDSATIKTKNSLGQNISNPDEKVLFADYLNSWLERHKLQIDMVTYAGYIRQLKTTIDPYFRDLGVLLTEVTPDHIEDFYAEKMKTVKASTIKKYHANIRKALQAAFIKGIIPSNPADRVTLPKIEQYMGSYYNSTELQTLFERVKGTRLEFAVFMASYYGLRRSEIVGLKWDAIDFDYKTFAVKHTVTSFTLDGKDTLIIKDKTKSSKSYRTLPLVPQLEELLNRIADEIEENRKIAGNSYDETYLGYIYVDNLGKIVRPDYITESFQTTLTNQKLKKIRFHDLRHSCATLLRHEGVPM